MESVQEQQDKSSLVKGSNNGNQELLTDDLGQPGCLVGLYG
jgi:hypothetical protein